MSLLAVVCLRRLFDIEKRSSWRSRSYSRNSITKRWSLWLRCASISFEVRHSIKNVRAIFNFSPKLKWCRWHKQYRDTSIFVFRQHLSNEKRSNINYFPKIQIRFPFMLTRVFSFNASHFWPCSRLHCIRNTSAFYMSVSGARWRGGGRKLWILSLNIKVYLYAILQTRSLSCEWLMAVTKLKIKAMQLLWTGDGRRRTINPDKWAVYCLQVQRYGYNTTCV